METGLHHTIIAFSDCLEKCKKAADVYCHPAFGSLCFFVTVQRKVYCLFSQNIFINSQKGYLGIRIFCPT
jgi:hypothetical protein